MSRPGRWRHVPVWPLAGFAATLALAFAVLDHGVWRPHHTWGLAILVPAATLWTLARVHLGDAFTTRAEARTLVTRGPYARLRHPIYVSAELINAGALIFLGRFGLVLLPVALVALPIQVRRARREERVLEAAFGDAYRAYRRRTWF